jgi:hypothetical protein
MVSAKIIIIYRTRVGAGKDMITNNRVIYKKTVEKIYISGLLLLVDGQTRNCSAEKMRGSSRSSTSLDVIGHDRRLASLQTS